jgi:large subunit ribosomal protein L6
VRARHGLLRALAGNMVTGVSTGFTKRLEVQGVGFRAEVKGKSLVMNLGYSHQIDFPVPDDVAIAVEKDGKIAVSGIDRARVGQVAADIRSFRKPDRYKGKGVRYVGEHIALKEGKSS